VVRSPDLLDPLPADVDTAVFRIVQEAVTNVVRHSGTDRCLIRIGQRRDALTIEISDDGRGGPVSEISDDGRGGPVSEISDDGRGGPVRDTGYGIAGMRERAELLGGQLTAGPRTEGGFRVSAWLPLPPRIR
jgi:signal transduction histidine kinase